MPKRTYLAILDDGHDYQEIEYQSLHRNRSKYNLEDCRDYIAMRFGRNEAKRWKIRDTMRWEVEG